MTPDQLTRIEQKLDKIIEHIHNIDLTTARNTQDIAHHIRRTDALEVRVEQVAEQIRPIENHVSRVNGIVVGLLKFLAVVGAIVGIIKSISP